MIERWSVGAGIAVLCASTLAFAQSQAPQSQQPQGQQPRTEQPRTQQPQEQERRTGQDATVTIVGCLQEERNVPGREPNIAERAGVGEDFILTDASVQGQQPGAGRDQAGRTGTPGAAGTSGTAGARDMYQVTGIDDDRLRQHVGQRVEVTGRLQARAGMGGQAGGGATGTTGQGVGRTGTPSGSGTGAQSGSGAGAQSGGQTRDQSGSQAAGRNDQNEQLMQVQATSIRRVSGDCPSSR